MNLLKISNLVEKILDLKAKVVVDADVNKLCEKIERLTETMNQIVAENKKLQSDIMTIKMLTEKNQAKGEQHRRRNNVEISGIPNSILDEGLKNTVISICEDSGVGIDPKDIEGCHRRPVSRYSTGQDKRVIVKFVNWKLSEALLRDKKRISSKSFNHLNVPNKAFVSVSFCPYYRYIWGRCKDLQRQGQINHSFCLGGVLCIKLSENGNPIKPYHMNDIPDFPSE